MEFSVGVLYSCHTFLELVNKAPVQSTEFEKMFDTFEVAKAEWVLQATQLCEWVSISHRGEFAVSKRGALILEQKTPADRLRLQLQHLIVAVRPPWSSVLTTGRKEAEKYLPQDAKQCFREAGLLEGYDDGIVDWWDRAAGSARMIRDETKKDSGRLGEKNSLLYERERTGKEPLWQGFESNFAGYDLLSFRDKSANERLPIEVKSSYARLAEASFFVSRHEWNVSQQSPDYLFHLWALKPRPQLFVVPKQDMTPHMPVDAGDGIWKQANIPMMPFKRLQVPTDHLQLLTP